MNQAQQHADTLNGVTLSSILDTLIQEYGFEGLNERIKINCFASNPSKKSSLTFLRKTAWARDKVEDLYIDTVLAKK